MSLRRASLIAALLLPAATVPAAAQFALQQQPPCFKSFTRLRDDAARKAHAIEVAGKRKPRPSPQEACRLFNTFSTAEEKLIKYAVANAEWCGIPPQIIKTMKAAHTRTRKIRTKICRVAAEGPPRPPGPTLSETLTAPVPDANNIKRGGGSTFNTLTGTPIGSQ